MGTGERAVAAASRVTALVREPSDRLDDGLVENSERVPVDLDRARGQWRDYVSALQGFGWRTLEVPPAPDHPDAVFVEDTVVMANGVAILSSPGHPSRRGEVAGTAAALGELGLPTVPLPQDARLDGGDVLKVGRTCYVGRSARTNAAAVSGMRDLLAPAGWEVVAVPVTRVLHLKTAVTALPDGTVIGFEPSVDHPRLFPRFLPVPEPEGAAVVVLSHSDVLLSASAPRTRDLLTSLGYRVHAVEVDEFEKLEGCVTCLSVRLRDAPSVGEPS